MSPWLWLSAAIGFEMAGSLLLKASNDFANVPVGMAAVASYSICFWLLAPVLKTLPVGVAYAVWAGAGITLVAIVGRFVFGQSLGLARVGSSSPSFAWRW